MRSRILYVSGRQSDVRLLSEMLHELPLTLDSAKSVQGLRAKLLQNDYQAILTDAVLEDGTWLDVLHIVRDCPDDVQVIVTSALADASLWAETLNLGVYDVLAQPFDKSEVRRILSYACGHYHHQAHAQAAV